MAKLSTADLEWMLILSLPNGGSTALAKLLLTAGGTAALNPRAEGQWLVPAMSAPRARWDPESSLDYQDIRSRWIEAIQQNVTKSSPCKEPYLIIEKSPPNMCRYHQIVSMLAGMKIHTVVMTRDPFPTCASWHMRYGPGDIERNWGWPGLKPVDEDAYFRALGEIWMKRAKYLDSARAFALHWMRYEDFSDRLSVVFGELVAKIPRLATANLNATIAVKDYPPQKVRNMNSERLSLLTSRQRKAISSALTQDPELVERFGYEVLPPQ